MFLLLIQNKPNAVIKFFQDRGYSTYHGDQDPTGGVYDHHVHVE